MTISNVAITRMVTLISADIDDGLAGTGTTLPLPTDTDLEAVVADTEVDATSTTTNSSFTVTHLIASTLGNGNDLTEWQLRMNSEATQLNRVVTAALTKDNTIEVTKITLFTVFGE